MITADSFRRTLVRANPNPGIRTPQVILLLLALGLVPGYSYCEEQPMYAAHPIVRVILPSKSVPEGKDRRIRNATLEYDENYRRPDEPADSVPVKCDETLLIGVYLVLDRRVKVPMFSPAAMLQSVWTHDSVDSNSHRLNHTDPVRYFHESQRMITSELLVLTPELKKDGVWRLEVSIDAKMLFQDSFELTGCDVNNGTG